MRSWRGGALVALWACMEGMASAGSNHAPAPNARPAVVARGVNVALGADGSLGAWLLAGPFERGRLPAEDRLAPRAGAGWKVASSWRGGPIDVVAALGSPTSDRVAYAGGVLHIARGGRHYLLLGVDDGVAVLVDGKRVFSRDEARPRHDDDDLLALDLGAGDHTLVLALHQHTGAWTFSARLLDADLQPPRGAAWVLPGTTAEDARTLATRMSAVTLDRGLKDDGYRATLTVRYPAGAPRETSLEVRARLVRRTPGAAATASAFAADSKPLFDVAAGDVGIDSRAVGELVVQLPFVAGAEVEDDDWTVRVDVAGRTLDLPFLPRRKVREAIAHADRALAEHEDDSVTYLRDRLADFVARGDGDLDAQLEDARRLDTLAGVLEKGKDPWQHRTGPMRRAYRSVADGKLTGFALYVPPGYTRARSYPLIVALHGMNGQPMEMLMWLFGHDDPARDGYWEDRHPRQDLEPLDALVVAPDGHFNAMYRDIGEADVMQAIDWTAAHYAVDPARVTITGPSMGGIGTAACALHYPDRFAAAEPLCGYHSYFLRGDIGNARLRPWERFIAEQRSNVFWAENGMYIPMYIVHGTRDLPVEDSGVLIDRYDELHYSMVDEHPDLGHNVWQTTYEDLKGAKWLLDKLRPLHPRTVRFKTARTRWGDDAWVHVRELASSGDWGEVNAHVGPGNAIHATTKGVASLAFDRDTQRVDDAAPLTVNIDGAKLVFEAGEPVEMHRLGATWRPGPAVHEGLFKHGTVTGPIRDVFQDPILFVWGASDPHQARANEETARAWARVRWGVQVSYPLMSDTDFYARGEAVANDKALFLVGNAKSNRIVRELEPSFPIRIDGNEINLGGRLLATKGNAPADRSQLGVAFIRPNPLRPDRYVVVVEGVGPLGTWRSTSLPDMLPDYVVFDEDVQRARGLLMLGAGEVRAAGFFDDDWSVAAR